MPHLISIADLSAAEINHLLQNAQLILDNKEHLKNSSQLNSQLIANLFFEPSTRTRVSFEVAATRLGANVINLDLNTSSTVKGETLIDTIKNLEAMSINYFVIRHQENLIFKEVIPAILPSTKMINAGNGSEEHPTQALLDMLTIKQHKKTFENLTVAIIGDIKHSRVAHSNIKALKKLNVAEIRLIGPDEFMENIPDTKPFNNLNEGLMNVDVIMLLRIQKERMEKSKIPNSEDYLENFGITKSRLQCIKPDAIIMHAGPVNHNIEIANEVLTDKRSVILQQVQNGLAMRMAVLMHLSN